ncbi:MAG: hypothetical protein WCY58_08145, partial [Mariniphaga sp.]
MTETSNLFNVEFLFTPVVNYAIQQNKISLVRKLRIENLSNNDLADIHVKIECEPEFANRWEHQIDVIPANQSMILDVHDFRLSSRFLSELTEKIAGEIELIIFAGEEVIFQKIYSVDVLAFDQWNGIGVLPEMAAAFITPNHPEISKILNSASGILNRWTGNPSFDAYQSLNPDRVKKQMAAIYEAI